MESEIQAAYVRVVDGDTFVVNIQGVPDVFGVQLGVRVLGIDTPEMHAPRECERRQAVSAKEFAGLHLSQASDIRLTHVKRDKYFRILARVWLDGADLGSMLKTAKLAVDYDGGRKVPWVCARK